ncbi:MAG TPA: ABC transporter substrate-binding protein [Stellaceae bacterium]|nr:ABC transporter substrate-binding protein [Stellaceae bacterium]
MKIGQAAFLICAFGALLCGTDGNPAAAQQRTLVLGLPGVPPIFANVNFYVADKEGFFKKYGAEVEIKQFDTGTAAARAVVSGDLDFSLSPTALIVSQIANADVPVVAIYGMPNPDWAIGTTDGTKAGCADMKGQQVGVDTPGGARSIALKEMLFGCHMTIDDVQQVGLGSNTAAAMIAGQISYGVLHLDDVPEIESHGKTVTIVTTIAKSDPTSHYLVGVARKDRVAEKHDAYVRFAAALIAADHFMADAKNADTVAEIATITGRSKAIAKGALKRFLDIGFWAIDDDGLAKNKIEALVATQEKIGNIKPGRAAPSYDQLVDLSVWRDADALYKKLR